MEILEGFTLSRAITDSETLDWIKTGKVPEGAVFDSHKFWESKRTKLNELHRELQEKPDCEKLCLCFSFGSVLNAYREGDISFDKAIEVLEEIAVQNIADKLTGAFK